MKVLFIIGIVALLIACNKDDFQTKPSLKVKSYSTKVVPLNGTFTFTLTCTDKEGDVQDSLTIIKVRQNQTVVSTIRDTIRYKMPTFPNTDKVEVQGTLTYQEILSAITPPNIPGSSPPQKQPDTLLLKFAVRDVAGHASDTIVGDQIIVIR